MKRFALGLLATVLVASARSVPAPPATPLQAAVDRAVMDTVAEFHTPALKPEQLAVTVIDLRGPAPVWANFRGDERFYPASVIKLFYLAATQRWLEDRRIADTPELRRAMHDMIIDSSNDATNYIVDVLTGTTSGPELPPAELEAWSEKRRVVTQYFQSLGYQNVNANRKTWGDGPFGREKQDMDVHPPARNYLSTNDTARLLMDIATGQSVTAARSAEMLALLARDPFMPKTDDPDNQSLAFSGAALTPGMKLWSKAGWVSWARNDAALIELPGGGRVIIVTFTDGREHANNRAIIPALVKRVLANLP
ncbi:MAG TPA: serine hydrolase [Lacunisphaera sp.]